MTWADWVGITNADGKLVGVFNPVSGKGAKRAGHRACLLIMYLIMMDLTVNRASLLPNLDRQH